MAVFTFRHIAAFLMLLNFLLFYWGILPWFLFAGFMYIWVCFGAVRSYYNKMYRHVRFMLPCRIVAGVRKKPYKIRFRNMKPATFVQLLLALRMGIAIAVTLFVPSFFVYVILCVGFSMFLDAVIFVYLLYSASVSQTSVVHKALLFAMLALWVTSTSVVAARDGVLGDVVTSELPLAASAAATVSAAGFAISSRSKKRKRPFQQQHEENVNIKVSLESKLIGNMRHNLKSNSDVGEYEHTHFAKKVLDYFLMGPYPILSDYAAVGALLGITDGAVCITYFLMELHALSHAPAVYIYLGTFLYHCRLPLGPRNKRMVNRYQCSLLFA